MKEISKVNTQIKTVSEIEQICKVLWKVNLIVAYPLTDVMIESWANHLLRLRPQVTIEQLDKILDKFITGEYEYVTNKGLSNIILVIDKQQKQNEVPDYASFVKGD